MQTARSDTTLVRNDIDLLTVVFDEMVCMILRGDVTEDLLDKFVADIRKIRDMIPGEYAVFTVLETDRVPPSEQTRRRLLEMVKKRPSRSRCIATVIQNDGFRASITRAVLTELDMAYKSPDRKVFTEIIPAARWVAEMLSRDLAWSDRFAEHIEAHKKIMKTA